MGMGDLGNTDKGPPEMAREDVYFAPWLCGSVTEITSCRLLWISAILPRVMFCDLGRLENSLPYTESQTNKHPTIEFPAEARRRRVF